VAKRKPVRAAKAGKRPAAKNANVPKAKPGTKRATASEAAAKRPIGKQGKPVAKKGGVKLGKAKPVAKAKPVTKAKQGAKAKLVAKAKPAAKKAKARGR
jgi:histone H1/5